MEDVIKKILDCYSVGYSVEEIVKEVKDELGNNEDRNYNIVCLTIDKAVNNMSEEDKQKISELRKLRRDKVKYEKMTVIADQVKQRAFENPSACTQKEKLKQAITMVAKLNDLNSNTVKNYTKMVYPCFYEEYSTNAFMNEEYFVDLAKRIIDKKMLKTHAKAIVGFDNMMQYLEKNKPELFQELNESFALANANFNKRVFVENEKNLYNSNKYLLIDIILKFRVPVKVVCQFLQNNEVFMNKLNISEEEFINTIKDKMDNKPAIEWYLTEMADYMNPDHYDEYINYRIAKFQEFVAKFNLVKDDLDKVKKLVRAETTINLSSITSKTANHDYKQLYQFDHNDLKTIMELMYKNALGEQDVQKTFNIPRISRTRLVDGFIPENFEEEMLLHGYNKLTEYKNDVAFAYRVGRK